MASPFIAGFLVTGSSGTFPAIQAGDLLVITAVRWSSGTAPTAPSGWTSSSSSTSTYGRVVGYRYAASSSTGASTSVWTNAEALYVSVWRNVSIGNTASTASSSKAGGPPALTLTQPGTSWVGLMSSGNGVAPNLPTGMTERLRASGSGVNDLYADTNGSVSSWAAQTGNAEIVTVVELIPTTLEVSATLPISWQIETSVTAALPISWNILQLSVTGTVLISWDIQGAVTATLPISWMVASRGNWQNNIRSAAFREALEDPIRVVTSRAELVDYSGNPLTWTTSDGTALDLRLGGASVSLDGSISESWKMNATAIGTEWVPTTPDHPLDPRAQAAIRLWWGLLVDGGEIELPVGTFAIGDVVVNDDGVPEISITGRDMLSIPKGAGYDGQTLDLGGMTVDAALIRLFSFLSPNIPVRCEATSITLPSVYEVGSGKPNEDWDKIAATAGWIVRTDRMGAIVIGPPGSRGVVVRSLQEGEDCVITGLKRTIKNVWYNRVCVQSSSSEIDPPVYYVAQDNDPSSPTWVGLGVIRSMPIVKSDTATSVEACKAQAELLLSQNAKPLEQLTWTQPPDPTYDYLDMVQVARAQSGVGGVVSIEQWSFTLPISSAAPGMMSVTAAEELMR